MTDKDSGKIQSISSQKLPVRIALGVIVIVAIAFGWFTVRWQLGNMLAELTLPTEPNAKQIAELALNLSPGDPLAKWLRTNTREDVFNPESIQNLLKNHQDIVRLSPHNFTWWVELGRAYEQAEQPENAEKAFLRAIELAPAYTYPHWQLGNFYLRNEQPDKAFVELRKAAENNPIYRDQVFSIAWDYYEKNTDQLEKLAGNSSQVRTGLAKFYAMKERAEDSLRMWNTLSPEEKQKNDAVAKIIARSLYDTQFYRQAIEFVRDLNIEPKAKHETIQNESFEDKIDSADKTYFGWRVAKTEKMDVKTDPTQSHDGDKSLRIVFDGYDKAGLYNIYQIVTVDRSAKYQLSFWLKTKELKSSGMPVLEIINAKNNKIIASSDSFPTGINDWKKITIDFTAPEETEAVIIRTSRAFCGDQCPLVGMFWYDDFQLKKNE